MLPGSLKSTYQQYKHDTDPPKHVLAIKNFLLLAEFIVERQKDKNMVAVNISVAFSKAIERAIEVRKGFVVLLEKAGATLDMTSDEKHKFFVGVLEKVRDTLRPPFWQSAQGAKKKAGGLDETESLAEALNSGQSDCGVLTANLFDVLKAYDVPEIDLTAAEGPTEEEQQSAVETDAKAKEAVLIDCESELQNTAADRFLAKALWESYANRQISLSSVAIATNTALDLARRIEEEVSHIFKPDGYVEGMIEKLVKIICAVRGLPPTGSRNGTYPFNIQLYETMDFCMVNAFIFFNGFLQVLSSDDSVISGYNGQVGWYDKTVRYDTLSSQGKFEADRAAIMELFPEFDRLGGLCFTKPTKEFDSAPSVVDEMTRGLRLMSSKAADEDPKPLWMALATSLHLDVVRVLGDEIDRPYREMVAVNNIVDLSIREHFKYHRSSRPLSVPGWDKDADKALEKLQKDSEFWREGANPLYAVLGSAGLRIKTTAFLKRHALYCGLWVADMRARLHHLGVAVNRAYGSILYAGHLYNAMEAEGLIPEDKKWDDMELFFDVQGGRDTFFIGKAPTDNTEYHRQICLVMGFSATESPGLFCAMSKLPSSLTCSSGLVPSTSELSTSSLWGRLHHAISLRRLAQQLVATTALLDKAAKVYLSSLGGSDKDNEPRSQVKNKIAILEATTKMRKVEPDSPWPTASQPPADRFGVDFDSNPDDDDDDDDDDDEEGDFGPLPSWLGQGLLRNGDNCSASSIKFEAVNDKLRVKEVLQDSMFDSRLTSVPTVSTPSSWCGTWLLPTLMSRMIQTAWIA
ncbi:hypothetical protein MFIFM68171_11205 [Madurella fahalii]|uniref:DUF6604 domain-containing protein n=1 Tax=Madurella fahalii TaxID=1157608 RepID=A0ABQ0GTD1_9PEZI